MIEKYALRGFNDACSRVCISEWVDLLNELIGVFGVSNGFLIYVPVCNRRLLMVCR